MYLVISVRAGIGLRGGVSEASHDVLCHVIRASTVVLARPSASVLHALLS